MSSRQGRYQALANRIWYGESWLYVLLLPLSVLFAAVSAVRRFAYRMRLLRSREIPVPVVVVGNITVGGAGKTPVIVWLAETLKKNGMKPAIISRGYGGDTKGPTEQVSAESDPDIVGDEPILLAQRTGCPVFVNADRVAAARKAVRKGADVILSDDGLQHYRLRRDVELAVVDGERGLGNGRLLPAGPLREPVRRLKSVDRVLVQHGTGSSRTRYGHRKEDPGSSFFSLRGETLRHAIEETPRDLKELANTSVHAVAGIGNPDRFFRHLEHYGLNVIRHPLPDHAEISTTDILFGDDLPVIVTEKDVVKCRAVAIDQLWYLPVKLVFDNNQNLQWIDVLHAKLRTLISQKAVEQAPE